jgi:DNA gyrase subunit B
VDQESEQPLYLTEKEWKKFKPDYMKKREAKLKAEAQASGEELVAVADEELGSEVKELWEIPKMDELLKKIESSGMGADLLSVDLDKKPTYRLRCGSIEKDISDLESLLETIREFGREGASIQRYKGLGEMNPEQLWETTMDPARRKLLLVKFDDVVEAERVFTTLMGDKVEPRRQFIEQNALEVRNLDI